MRLQHTQTVGQHSDLTQLVRTAQSGDRKAFGELVTRYQRAVYAIVLRRLRNHAEAQEVCQEVFMQALRKIDQLRDPRCFGGWLRSIAARLAINRAMRRGPLITVEPETIEANCPDCETPLEVVLTRERSHQVHAGLGRLGTSDRETLVAFYFHGRSLVEMSEKFASPVGTIKRRLHVARKRLAKELEELAPV